MVNIMKKRGKRGQISFEYMSVVGIATIVAISLLGVAHYYSRQTEVTINANQVDRIAKQIVDTAESLYYYGEPSRATIKVYIPDGINSVNISGQELSFKFMTQAGEADMFYTSTVNLQGDIDTSYGLRHIHIEAKEGYVWINGT